MAHNTLDGIQYQPKTKRYVLIGIVLSMLALGFYLWSSSQAPDPLKVLVLVDYNDETEATSEAIAEEADVIIDRLKTLGFEVVRMNDPESAMTLAQLRSDPEKAARHFQAAWIVQIKAETTMEEHALTPPLFEAHTRTSVRVFHVDDSPDSGSEDTFVRQGVARNLDAAKVAAHSSQWANLAASRAIRLLLEAPRMHTMLTSDADVSNTLGQAQKYLKKRNQAIAMLEKRVDRYMEERKEDEAGPVEVRYHSRFESDLDVMGLGARGVLVKTKGYEYDYTLESKLQWYQSLESVSWVKEDGTREDIWTGYNVFGDVGISRDGKTVAFSEDLYGLARTITVWREESIRRIKTNADAYYYDLKPSPSGRWIAGYEGSCNRCRNADKRHFLIIRNTETGEEVLRQSREAGEFEAFDWSTDDQLLVIHTLPDAEPDPPSETLDEGAESDSGDEETKEVLDPESAGPAPTPEETRYFPSDGGDTLWAVNPNSPSIARAIHQFDSGTSIHGLLATSTGAMVNLWSNGAVLMEFDIENDDVRVTELERSIRSLQVSPDGRHLVFSVGGGSRENIAIMARHGGPMQTLTQNSSQDHRPFFSQDGQRIFYESIGENPAFERRNRTTSIVSIPVPGTDASSGE